MSDLRPFKFRNLLGTLILLTAESSHAVDSAPLPPQGSWEAWLVQVRAGIKPTPARPDGKNLSLPLPLWIDCQLSWAADRPKAAGQAAPPDQIVLLGNAKLCRGQLEDWAVD